MKNVLQLISTILNHVLINALIKSMKNTFSTIVLFQQQAQRTLSTIFPTYPIEIFFYSMPICKNVLWKYNKGLTLVM